MVNLVLWAKPMRTGLVLPQRPRARPVFHVSKAAHLNNVDSGATAVRAQRLALCQRQHVQAGRLDELKCHPTVKPVALVADAIRRTGRGDIVLDTFWLRHDHLSSGARRPAGLHDRNRRALSTSPSNWQAFSRKTPAPDGGLL